MTNCRCDPFTGDECQACKNKLLVDKEEYERLKRLEAAAIEWANAEYSKSCTIGRKNPAVDTKAAALAYRLYKLVTKATS